MDDDDDDDDLEKAECVDVEEDHVEEEHGRDDNVAEDEVDDHVITMLRKMRWKMMMSRKRKTVMLMLRRIT